MWSAAGVRALIQSTRQLAPATVVELAQEVADLAQEAANLVRFQVAPKEVRSNKVRTKRIMQLSPGSLHPSVFLQRLSPRFASD